MIENIPDVVEATVLFIAMLLLPSIWICSMISNAEEEDDYYDEEKSEE